MPSKNSFNNFGESVRSSIKKASATAKTLAVSAAMLGVNLSSCSVYDSKIVTLDPKGESVTFSIIYKGYKDGHQDFAVEVKIKKTGENSFEAEINQAGESYLSEDNYKAENPDVLLQKIADDIAEQVPMNTRTGYEDMVRKIHEKTAFVAEEYKKMLNEGFSSAEKIEISYNPQE
ncbi:hypothetical protein D8B45_05980 [Candidatus Gracilibacteria bacterium]|nr:MAG: hypothetical protein D8B45_05980 [Candidatus Gracilibacteria bacterium]